MDQDPHMADPNQPWTFDESVTQVFPQMLRQSIPGLADMRRFTTDISRALLLGSGHQERELHVMDIGASRGDAVESIRSLFPEATYSLLEASTPMMRVLETRYGNDPQVNLVMADLSERPEAVARYGRVDLMLSVLTLMFIPAEDRQVLLQSMHDAMSPGGALIVVEKCLGRDARSQILLQSAYHSFKRQSGYTDEQVERKRLSLKGALVPWREDWIEDALHGAGFVSVQSYWRCLQFAGWVAFRKETA